MGKTSDELRDWVRRARADEHMDLRELDSIADRIDVEMVELPRDRDGVPIHVGDTVYRDSGRKATVARIELSLGENGIDFSVHGNFFILSPENLTHTRPDSLESIADELERYVNDSCSEDEIDGMTVSTLVDFAERIRKLAEREGE